MLRGKKRNLSSMFAIAFLALRGMEALSHIRIGTRPSPLALKQAQSVASALQEAHPSIDTEFIILESSSEHHKTLDKATQDKPLAMTNVDFTSVIDNAIMNGDVDIGVHSLKDIPPDHKWYTESLTIACFLPRACPLDVLIGSESVQMLGKGARVGSSSTRRQSQLLSARPDLKLINLRGNVQTRLEHLKDGLVDALVMARAGLDRLGISDSNITFLSAYEMMPGPGQGIVGVICRKDDIHTIQQLQTIDNLDARMAATAERQVLNTVDANLVKPYCGRPPLAAFMEPQDSKWVLKARLLRPDGKAVVAVERQAPRDCNQDDARAIGEDAGIELVLRAGDHFFDESA